MTSTRLDDHSSSVEPWPSEWAHLNLVPQLGPSTWSVNFVPQLVPQFGPSTWSLNLVSQLGPSTWSLNLDPTWTLNLVPQLGPSTCFLNLVPQLGPSIWSLNLVPQFGPSAWSLKLWLYQVPNHFISFQSLNICSLSLVDSSMFYTVNK